VINASVAVFESDVAGSPPVAGRVAHRLASRRASTSRRHERSLRQGGPQP